MAVAAMTTGVPKAVAAMVGDAHASRAKEQLKKRGVQTQSSPTTPATVTVSGEETSASSSAPAPLLLRVARGEAVERSPVWLMRQAGRYMAAFREYSTKYPFRMRSETPEIAIELSLQPYRAFKPDGVIFFSDILTPLPAMGVEFDVIPGKGPKIANPIRSLADVDRLSSISQAEEQIPFVKTILSSIRGEIDAETTLLGFVGTPWTLCAYSVEGQAEKNCMTTKTLMLSDPDVVKGVLEHYTEAITEYACYQIESGAQVIQLFDSWAHHLGPDQFKEWSLPYVERVIAGIRSRHPSVPVIYFANGCGGKMSSISTISADVIGIDWAIDMAEARTLMPERILQGNVDPTVLLGPKETIESVVKRTIQAAGQKSHILNIGHGVIQGTPEDNVKRFIDVAKETSYA